MKDHSGCTRAYSRETKAYYAELYHPKNDIIMIGMYDLENGGTSGQFRIEWEPVGFKTVPRLKCYDDSWSALTHFSDLLEKMAEIDGKNITEPEFVKILDDLGIVDDTSYVRKNN